MSMDSLCPDCIHTKLVQGGRYYLCTIYKDRVRSDKYPYQPVTDCDRYASIGGIDSGSDSSSEA